MFVHANGLSISGNEMKYNIRFHRVIWISGAQNKYHPIKWDFGPLTKQTGHRKSHSSSSIKERDGKRCVLILVGKSFVPEVQTLPIISEL